MNLYVEVDHDALSEAAETLGTKTKKDTVNAALLEVAERRRRPKAREELVDTAPDRAVPVGDRTRR